MDCPPGHKSGCRREWWWLVEVQILNISAHVQTLEVTILSTIFICHEVYDL